MACRDRIGLEKRIGGKHLSAQAIVALVVIAAVLLVVLVTPFLVPVPPLQGTVPPRQLADPDSQFLDINGLEVHYKSAGRGDPTLLLLHGFAASQFSWHEVLGPLAQAGSVIAFDRAAFGLTSRPLPGEWNGPNPYSTQSQVDTVVGLLDLLSVDRAVLVGHSAGGTIAALTALQHPDRVRALVLVDPAIYHGGQGIPWWLRLVLRTPQVRRLGPLIVRQLPARRTRLVDLAWHDPSKATPEVLAGYTKPLRAENWDRALWEFALATQSFDLPERVAELTVPVLVITGDDDRVIPTKDSVRLASALPNARLAVVPDCGHIPQEEQPEAFLRLTLSFLSELPDD